jgi:hypothetical protein
MDDDKESTTKMTYILLILAIVAAGAVWRATHAEHDDPEGSPGRADGRRDRRDRRIGGGRRADDLAPVVVTAMEDEWVKRFEVSPQRLREAVVDRGDEDLLSRIDHEVGIVDLRFAATAPRSRVATTVIVSYRDARDRTTATVDLPWDHVPDTVRADLIRDVRTPAFRKWKALA